MELLPLLGRNLKSEEIAKLLDQWKADVVYQPDWLDEEEYGVNAIEQGIALVFDRDQTLTTIYLYPSCPIRGNRFDSIELDVPIFHSSADVTAFADRNDLEWTEDEAMVIDRHRRGICLKWNGYLVHYELIDDKPVMVWLARS